MADEFPESTEWIVRDQHREVIPPAELSAPQVIDRHLEVTARGIDTAHHHLIAQHQLANELRARDLERTVTARNAREHIHAIEGQRIEEIELQGGDAGG